MVKLHHINICSDKVSAVDAFYRTVLGLDDVPQLRGARIDTEGYAGRTAFVTDGNVQIHLSTPDLDVAFRTGQAINPVARGHIAFRTDDIEAVKKCLTGNSVRFSDYGIWAMKGWYQIFFHDPSGNIVEVHQVVGD